MFSRATSSGNSREFVIMFDSRIVPSTASQQQHCKTHTTTTATEITLYLKISTVKPKTDYVTCNIPVNTASTDNLNVYRFSQKKMALFFLFPLFVNFA